MICCAEKDNQLKPAEGKSGTILICATTSAGLFIGIEEMREIKDGKYQCVHCKEWKLPRDFGCRLERPNLYKSWCRNCTNTKSRDRYANPVIRKEQSRRYKELIKDPERYKKRRLMAKRWRDKNHKRVNELAKNRYRNNPRRSLLWAARRRARNKRLPFSITIEDIIVPNCCPVLGIKLKVGRNHPQNNSPTLDRIIPEKGYVKGNILVISFKANSIKSNGSVEEIGKVYKFYKAICNQFAVETFKEANKP